MVHPSLPRCPNSSSKRYDARIALHGRSTMRYDHEGTTIDAPNDDA